MLYVYILQSTEGEHFYVGTTDDLRARLQQHNAGQVPHTAKHGPWKLKTYTAFSDAEQAGAFERYLKSASGRAFAKSGCEPRYGSASQPFWANQQKAVGELVDSSWAATGGRDLAGPAEVGDLLGFSSFMNSCWGNRGGY